METQSKQIYCPYCGESINIMVDDSVQQQQYIEDCSVCCRPIELDVSVKDDVVTVTPKRDDE